MEKTIEDLRIELDRYTDYLDMYICPADDCSLCMAETCGRESLADTIETLADKIAELQEGRAEQ